MIWPILEARAEIDAFLEKFCSEIIWPLASQWFLLENTSQNRSTYISFLDTSWKLDLNLTGHENSTTHFNLIYMLWYVIIWVGSRGLILLVGYVYLPIKIFDIQMTLPEMTTVELSFFFTVGNFAILEIFLFGTKCDEWWDDTNFCFWLCKYCFICAQLHNSNFFFSVT